jgi:hypothetical protein
MQPPQSCKQGEILARAHAPALRTIFACHLVSRPAPQNVASTLWSENSQPLNRGPAPEALCCTNSDFGM